MSEKIIKYTDDGLFTKVNITYKNKDGNEVTGWLYVDNYGYVHKDEHMARLSSCTHRVCECGEITYKHRINCQKCLSKKETERFMNFPTVVWDEYSPIFLKDSEQMFTDLGEIEDYCEDNDIKIEDLELCSAVALYAYELDPFRIYENEIYEEVPTELELLFDEFNKKIKEKQIILSYQQKNERVIIKPKVKS